MNKIIKRKKANKMADKKPFAYVYQEYIYNQELGKFDGAFNWNNIVVNKFGRITRGGRPYENASTFENCMSDFSLTDIRSGQIKLVQWETFVFDAVMFSDENDEYFYKDIKGGYRIGRSKHSFRYGDWGSKYFNRNKSEFITLTEENLLVISKVIGKRETELSILKTNPERR